jgi:anti-anti-sigma factor
MSPIARAGRGVLWLCGQPLMDTSPAFPLAWRSDLAGEAALVVVEGELDRLTTPALRDHLEWLLAWVPGRLVVDLAGVTFADVGAHRMLADVVGHTAGGRVEVVLSAPSAPLRRLLDVLGPPAGVTVDRW